MNQEYVKINECAVVSDEKGVLKQVAYTDKTDEIFVKENLIEDMKSELVEVKSAIKRFAGDNGKPNLKMFLHSVLGMGATFAVTALMLMAINPDVINSYKLVSMLVVSGSVGVSILIGEYMAELTFKKYKEGCLSKKDYLEREIDIETEKLKQLEISASKISINQSIDLNPIKVNHQPELSRLRHELDMYHYIGANLKKLIRLQNKGQLRTYLTTDYNEQEIATIDEQIKNHQLKK